MLHSNDHRMHGPPPPAITDPLLSWAVATEFRYFPQYPRRIPLLVESPKTGPRVIARRFEKTESRAALIEVPQMFLAPPGGIAEFPYFCILLNADRDLRDDVFHALSQLESEGLRYEFGLPLPAAALDAAFAGRDDRTSGTHYGPLGPPSVLSAGQPSHTGKQMQAQTPGSGPGQSTPPNPPAAPANVVMAVIDDGIAFAHERFRKTGNAATRFENLWIQDLGPGGTEFDAVAIDAALAMCTHGGLVDESEVYRVTGAEDYTSAMHKGLGRGIAHGTLVLDIAAGHDPRLSPPTNRPIIAVQLPDRAVRDTSGAYLTPYAFMGVLFILLRAVPLGKPGHAPPVVINLSYDIYNGPHDGTSVFEKAVDWLLAVWYPQPQFRGQASVVLPAGNHYLWRGHAHCDMPTGTSNAFSWRLVPDDRTPSAVELWVDRPQTSTKKTDVHVRVTAPDGFTSGWMKEGDPTFRHPPAFAPQPLWQVSFDSAAVTASRPRITIVTAATSPYDVLNSTEGVVPSGVWTIELDSLGGDATIDAWTKRDDAALGWPILGRQAYFDDPVYERFDSHGRPQERDNSSYVKRVGTVNGLGTGVRTVVIAGCRKSDLVVVRYSAAGPVVQRPPTSLPVPRVGYDPDASAVSDEYVEINGVLAAGTRSNSVGALNGTSVAAPQIARYIGAQFEKGTFGARTVVQLLAQQREAAHGGGFDVLRTGDGRIEDQLPSRPYVR